MFEKITDVPPGIDALKAVGKPTKDDYEKVVGSLFDEARQHGRRIRLLVQLGPECQGFTPDAVFQKAVGLRVLRLVDGYASNRHRVDPKMDTPSRLPNALASARIRQ
jgi:hypothetical protein